MRRLSPSCRSARHTVESICLPVARQRAFLSSQSALKQNSGAYKPTQATPVGPYYENILHHAPVFVRPDKPIEPPIPTPPPEDPANKARFLFGSRLVGPAERAERLANIRSRSTTIAGVVVPPRPEEPDNCCMSGCVNCVYDRYRDELEEWSAASAEAERRLQAQEHKSSSTSESMAKDSTPEKMPQAPPEGKLAKDLWDEDLYKDIPVGIREFMRLEKNLKIKHREEGTKGG